jgi:hypothetical protein
VKRGIFLAAALAALAVSMVVAAGPAAGDSNSLEDKFTSGQGPPISGVAEFRDSLGLGITECPQARLKGLFNEPLDRRQKDRVEQYSGDGNDLRTNEEFSCFPQNETSIDTNPAPGKEKNIVGGVNDYRNGHPMTGFQASVDNGDSWYSGIIPWSTSPEGPLQSGGDPAVVFDRQGIAYMAELTFAVESSTNGIGVARSTNGGYTWSRICFPIDLTPMVADDDAAACGGPGDPRQPGDGAVVFQEPIFEVGPTPPGRTFDVTPFHDKEYMAAGPRPALVEPVCFTPITRTPIPAGAPGCPDEHIGVDRLYVTWTKFEVAIVTSGEPPRDRVVTSKTTIRLSYSDDRGRSWSPDRPISGSARFCIGFGFGGPRDCDRNQFSVPTVNPHTGLLGVAFENFNTEDENQYLFVRSRDGGQTIEGPFFVTPVFDVNFPRAGAAGGRPDCTARGQQGGRIVYTNSCFRSNAGGNVVADKRGGDFADDFYLVMSDNRNGTAASSNADVFLFKSTDGGTTWIGPTRVNNDRSEVPEGFDRDCPPILADTDPDQEGNQPGPNPDCPAEANFGNDQWWPWVDINNNGHLNVTFKDRRLDSASPIGAGEWPTSKTRQGNYLVWTWGAQCTISRTATVTEPTPEIPRGATQCLAPAAAVIPQPTEPIDPGEGPVPGQGAGFVGPYHNFGISDFPSNFDYCFRAGIFCGDYDVVATADNDTKVYSHFTDARNGRSSGGPGGGPPSPSPSQPGRNPACEQSDAMVDEYSSTSADAGQKQPKKEDAMFLVTPCPADMRAP